MSSKCHSSNKEWSMAIFQIWIQGSLKMGATYHILMLEVLGQFQIDFSQWTPNCLALECLFLGRIFIKWKIIFQIKIFKAFLGVLLTNFIFILIFDKFYNNLVFKKNVASV
jgi:hypothetical protein